MEVYLDLVILLNFVVDLLLLLGTNRLCGHPLGAKRALLGATVGSVYAGACVISNLRYFGSTFWRFVFLFLMAGIAFGFQKEAIRRMVVFVLLSMSLGGIATGLNQGGFWGIAISAGLIFFMCFFGFSGRIGGKSFVPVELKMGHKRILLTALQDTGNLLKDPVTGEQVLVAGPGVAHRLLGLNKEQVRNPIGTMCTNQIPGLRLIPYRSVGQSAGMLLAIRPEKVLVNGVEQRLLVAFSPNDFGGNGYEALTGGAL